MNPQTTLIPRSEDKFLLRLASIAACLPPMAIGLFTLWPLFNYIAFGCLENGSVGQCRSLLPYNDPEFFAYPIGFTCLFITPIVGLVCYKYVVKKLEQNHLSFLELFSYAALTAIKFQLLAASIHFIFLIDISDFLEHGVARTFQMIVMFVFFGTIMHTLIIIFMTMPLTLLSVFIFRFISLQKAVFSEIQVS